jgi:hypothetical protein
MSKENRDVAVMSAEFAIVFDKYDENKSVDDEELDFLIKHFETALAVSMASRAGDACDMFFRQHLYVCENMKRFRRKP